MRNVHMKFQNRSIHGSKVNRRTDRQAKSNMPFQLFQSWGHKNMPDLEEWENPRPNPENMNQVYLAMFHIYASYK